MGPVKLPTTLPLPNPARRRETPWPRRLQSLAEGLGITGDTASRMVALRGALEIFTDLGDLKADEVRTALR
jgi:hypothetical protein